MAVRSELVLRCDTCGGVIHAGRLTMTDRGIRAHAQLNCGAYCSTVVGDICRGCRAKGQTAPTTTIGHSIGTQR